MIARVKFITKAGVMDVTMDIKTENIIATIPEDKKEIVIKFEDIMEIVKPKK